jgi:hypothetical protein
MLAQGVNLAGVAAVERRKGSQGLKVMESSFSVSLDFTCPAKRCPYAIIEVPQPESMR